MDQRELHLQHLGICHKLYHFIMKTLASQALKTVTLGQPSHDSSSSTEVRISNATIRGSSSKSGKVVRPETPCKGDYDKEFPPTQGLFGDSISPLVEHVEEKNKSCRNIDEMVGENMPASLPQAKKKMVSINDNVEEIILPSQKNKRSKSFQKSNSLDEEGNPKPLRSILKVGSNLNDKSNSIC